jgi:hypothetical protein
MSALSVVAKDFWSSDGVEEATKWHALLEEVDDEEEALAQLNGDCLVCLDRLLQDFVGSSSFVPGITCHADLHALWVGMHIITFV